MCGLISIVGKITSKEEKIFKQGLIVDSLRGEHSTGVAIVRKGDDSDAVIAKQVGNPFELFNDKRFDRAIAGNNRVLLGHNRYATQGAVNKVNAHPFEFWPIYGAHNGTLTDKWQLTDANKFSVDSQALYNEISASGVENAISKVRGAWALTWWDAEQNTFNVLRNSERTLYVADDAEKDVRYFCSEAEMLSLILNRNEVKYEKIYAIPADTWLSFEVDKDGNLGKAKSKSVKGKAPPPVQQQQYGGYYTNSSNQNRGNAGGNSQANLGVVGSPLPGYNQKIMRSHVVLELMSKKVDADGVSYLAALDPDHPTADIRVYVPKQRDKEFKPGYLVVGTINQFISHRGPYYRVNSFDLRTATIEEAVKYDEENTQSKEADNLIDITKGEGSKKKFFNHHGHEVSLAEWKTKYPNCDWCCSDLDPEAEDGIVMNDTGTVICSHCAKDDEVLQYVA